MAGDVAVAGIAGGGAGADRRVSLGLGYGKGAHEVAAFCRGAGAAGAADVHASVAVFCRRAAGGGGGAVLEMSTSRGRDRRGPEAPTSAVAISIAVDRDVVARAAILSMATVVAMPSKMADWWRSGRSCEATWTSSG